MKIKIYNKEGSCKVLKIKKSKVAKIKPEQIRYIIMDKFIFWCLRKLTVLTVKYTKHPEGKFQMGASVFVKGKNYPFIFESNTWW